jgi:hypothetical protein
MRGVLLGLMGAVLAAGADAAPVSPAEVVAAEREFAADAQKRGWIAAFNTYAAPDAITFQPDAVNVHTSLARQSNEPADRSLKWWPIWAGIASSGELGFTTGPYAVGDAAFGHYFTVWAKQADGNWRWIYDGGPRNDARSPFGPESEPVHLPMSDAAAGSSAAAWSEVVGAEAALADQAARDSKGAYLAHLSPDARIMGSPSQPATDAASRSAELDRRAQAIAFSRLGGRASQAGDLVFTYGDAMGRARRAPTRALRAHLAKARGRLETRVRRAARGPAKGALVGGCGSHH